MLMGVQTLRSLRISTGIQFSGLDSFYEDGKDCDWTELNKRIYFFSRMIGI